MPVLPHLRVPRAATATATSATDTRILESRQLLDAASATLHSLSLPARQLFQHIEPLFRRDKNNQYCEDHFISACYIGLDSGPSPGAIVGIVLGSIAGFLIVLWLLWVLSNGQSFIQTSTLEVDEDVVVASRRRSRSPRSRRSQRSTYQTEMRRTSPRRDRVIRQERIVRDIPPRRDTSRYRESVVVEESSRVQGGVRRVDGDDEIEVIEEHSSISGTAPPRRQSRRGSRYW